jgi:hypothetical protein
MSATAASITRCIKQIIGDNSIRVHTRQTEDGACRSVWQSFVWVDPERHAELTARFAASGLDRVTSTEFFLDVVQDVRKATS